MFLNLFKPKLEKEAYDAYFNRLPNAIQVEWFRDDDFIIGRITVENEEFFTQALSAGEFVDMVNELLLNVYNIPGKYHSVLLKEKKFRPSVEQFNLLNNAAIVKSQMEFQQQLA